MIWAQAIREGFIRLQRNKTIIGLALISVVLGKSMSLLEQLTHRSIPDLLLRSFRLDVLETIQHQLMSGQIASALSRLSRWEHLRPVDADVLWLMVAIAAGTSILAFFNSTGLTAVIRDLLVDHYYDARQIVTHGRQFVIPFLKFKGPIYLLAGFTLVTLGLVLGGGAIEGLFASSSTLLGFGLAAFLLMPCYSFLSIGSKLIVTEPHRRTVELYRLTGAFLVTHLAQVTVFYLILVSLLGGTAWMVQELFKLAVPFAASYGLAVFLLAYVTALGKLSSFIFFLRLRVVDRALNLSDSATSESAMPLGPLSSTQIRGAS